MAKGLVNESSLNSIAEAINVLNGTEGTYHPSEMGEAIIDAIPTETASGNPIHITDAAAYPAESVVTTLEPVQDLHGYDKPWPAGGNVNLMPPGEAKTYAKNGITFTSDGNGIYTIKGTATAEAYCDFSCDEYTFPDGSNHSIGFMNNQGKSSDVYFSFLNGVNTVDGWQLNIVNRTQYGYSTLSNKTINTYRLWVRSGTEVDMTISPMIISGTTSGGFPSTFSPYSNICPITGYTGVELKHSGADTLIYETHSVTFPQAQSPVYGCEVDWVNGVLRVTKIDVDLSSLTWTERQTGEVNVAYSTDLPQEYFKNANTADFIAEQYKFIARRNGAGELANPDSRPVGFYLYNGATSGSTVDRTSIFYILVPKEHQIGGRFVYPLAAPLEIALIPEVITLLKGENNIWTDAGTSEIEYKVDLNSYIQKLIDEAST